MRIKEIIEATIMPDLYEKGTASMWEDEYISERLLEMHLNPDIDVASRKKTTIEGTVRWIEARLDWKNKRILDLGCGPGLYCELLAAAGHQVTGMDYSKRSIEHARQEAARKGLDIKYVHQNYLDLDLEEVFDVVMMIYCDFDVVTPEERSLLLNNVHRALKPGGQFIFDTLNMRTPSLMNGQGRSWEVAQGGFWRNEPYLALTETHHYGGMSVILQQHIILSESRPPAIYRFWNHYYGPATLTPILNAEGFPTVKYYGGILPDDAKGTSEMVTFVVAQKE
ncbi:MAG: class I SAM-dependent methyltransferase [Methanomassiliicoccus sp.]|nr:class I SAM-dependent methyltransferase [Methanomassiliicoccus sp.]